MIVIEIGAVRFSVVGQVSIPLKPWFSPTSRFLIASDVHGLTMSDLVDAPGIQKFYLHFLDYGQDVHIA